MVFGVELGVSLYAYVHTLNCPMVAAATLLLTAKRFLFVYVVGEKDVSSFAFWCSHTKAFLFGFAIFCCWVGGVDVRVGTGTIKNSQSKPTQRTVLLRFLDPPLATVEHLFHHATWWVGSHVGVCLGVCWVGNTYKMYKMQLKGNWRAIEVQAPRVCISTDWRVRTCL